MILCGDVEIIIILALDSLIFTKLSETWRID